MADNTQLNAGSGGDLFRTLDDGAAKWPVGVTAFAEEVGDPDTLQIVTPAAGLPVHQQTGATWAVSLGAAPVVVTDGGGSLTVDGTVAVTGPVAVTGTFWQATQPVSGPLRDCPALLKS